jgi:hypothetical protein
MPFVAECLFCRRKVRAPDHAVGASISCPGCGSYFTLLPGAPARAGHLRTDPAEHGAPTAGTSATGIEPEAPPDLGPPAPFTALGSGAPEGRRRLSPLAVAALFVGSLALLFASLPGLDLLSLPCGGLGLLLGLAGLLGARASGRGLFLSAAGAGLSAAVLVVALAWPGLFNPLKGARARTTPESEQPRAVPMGKGAAGRDSTPVAEGGWVDASRDTVQVRDLRVRVLTAVVRTIPFKDPARARAARDRHLLITLRIYNLGTERRLAYSSWGEPSPGREEEVARLSDNTGRTYRLKSFGAGAEVVGRSAHASLAPGKYVDDMLIFDPPAAAAEHLRLELPGAACGAAETFRLQLPRTMVQAR